MFIVGEKTVLGWVVILIDTSAERNSELLDPSDRDLYWRINVLTQTQTCQVLNCIHSVFKTIKKTPALIFFVWSVKTATLRICVVRLVT